MPIKHPSDDPEEDDRKPAAKRIKKEPEDDPQSVTLDQLKVDTTVKPWEDKKDYGAIFRKYISIGDDGEEHYDVVDMERDAQRAVRRIQDHQEIVLLSPGKTRRTMKLYSGSIYLLEMMVKNIMTWLIWKEMPKEQ